jgi:hypothetical protein
VKRRIGWTLALVGPVVVAAACVPFRAHATPGAVVALLLVLVVVGAGILGGRLVGTVAGLVAALAFDVFHTRPYSSLRIDRLEQVEVVLLLAVTGLIVGDLVTRHDRSMAAAARLRVELRRMQILAELAAGGESPGALVELVRAQLFELLDASACRFERPPFVDDLPTLGHHGVPVPDVTPMSCDPRASDVALPVWGEGLEVGRFVVRLRAGQTGILVPARDRMSAVALADRLGALLVTHDR